MSFLRLTLFSLLVGVLTACTSLAQSDQKEWFVVKGLLAVDKQQQVFGGNLYPWEEAEGVISNACGFVEVAYEGKWLTAKKSPPSSIKVLTLTGEWCEVANLLHERLTLMRVKKWNGINFETAFTPILEDGDGELYVSDKEFIEAENLENLLKDIDYSKGKDTCYDKSYLDEDELKDLLNNNYAKDDGKLVCVMKGVYLNALGGAKSKF